VSPVLFVLDVDVFEDIAVRDEIQLSFETEWLVMLNFKGLTRPHVSVNTLVPADDIVVPPSMEVSHFESGCSERFGPELFHVASWASIGNVRVKPILEPRPG
jgi:hypothetical protein